MTTLVQRWTFTSDSMGYMLFKDGKPMGGAGVLHRPHGRHSKANAKMFREDAERECAKRNGKATGG